MNNLKKMVAFLLACLCLTMCVAPAMEISAASGYSFKSKGATATPGRSASSFIKANKKYFEKITIKKKYEKETKLKYKRVLSAILNYGIKCEYCTTNYCNLFKWN